MRFAVFDSVSVSVPPRVRSSVSTWFSEWEHVRTLGFIVSMISIPRQVHHNDDDEADSTTQHLDLTDQFTKYRREALSGAQCKVQS